MKLDNSCPFCHVQVESIQHDFLVCPFAKVVWFSSTLGLHVPLNPDPCQWLEVVLDAKDALGSQLVYTTL